MICIIELGIFHCVIAFRTSIGWFRGESNLFNWSRVRLPPRIGHLATRGFLRNDIRRLYRLSEASTTTISLRKLSIPAVCR
ncbi:hypothetical protein EUGRSUZ_A00447 [Eucalyptus grandis]|uniref:Uncharacterized protein n=2 Tax=Eucalyptus grandis TaxID=71139 RepID=A0ACC3M1P5_EUCGR|nr:hypothetical protein EUGRSUZ_A00447 [Eucalyptus grandis]